MCRLLMLMLASLVTFSEAAAAAESMSVFTDGSSIVVADRDGRIVLELSAMAWGPNWKWTGFKAPFVADDAGDTAQAAFTGKLGGTDVPFTYTLKVRRVDERTLAVDAAFEVERDTPLTLAVLSVNPQGPLRGAGRGTVADHDGERTSDVPFGRGSISPALRRLELTDGRGGVYAIELDPPHATTADKGARIVLAADRADAGHVQRVGLTVRLPAAADFALTPEQVDPPDDWSDWFDWRGTGHGPDSVIDMSGWLEAPAGRHGRIAADGDRLIYDGRPIKLWGSNLNYAHCAPPRDLAERRAAFYARYGINSVRLHKYADGSGWRGICADGATRFDPDQLDQLDYQVAQFKQRGIYTKLSANFGNTPLGPADLAELAFADQLNPDRHGWARAGQGALWFSDQIQAIQTAQLVNLLNHTNPHTGLRYADDPAVAFVELVNENSIFFFTTLKTLQQVPAVKRRAGELFFDWLKDKYRSREKLIEAWGEGVIGSFKAERMADESWADGRIYPVGNPWFFDPDQLDGSQKHRKARLLDTMAFFHDRQLAVYRQMVEAIRATGYAGQIVASNWQAGRAFSHYLNLHTDAAIGTVDRHNYYGGGASMLAEPGGGMLSSGMQQVADRPFMLSEWIHLFPNEFGVEGPALLGAYGVGLNGWDVSYIFQNGDDGRFRDQLKERWDVVVPQIIGVFPAVARQVLRGDVREADLTLARHVNVEQLQRGRIDFDDRVTMDYDVKEFGSESVPAAALAAARVAVRFADDAEPAPTVPLDRYQRDGAIHAATGQLAWTPGEGPRDGHVTLDTPGTQAVVGFARGVTADLTDVTITPDNRFAAIYVTALDREGAIADGDRLLITTIGRVRNSGMKRMADRLIERGGGPLRVEPIRADLQFKGPAARGERTVHVLDHDGRRTGRTVPIVNGRVTLDGAATQTIYYEVTGDEAAAAEAR